MSLPTHPASDELAALRARAYGPDADIDGDPAALARLYELENSARGAGMWSSTTAVAAAPEEPGSERVSDAQERSGLAHVGENGIVPSGVRDSTSLAVPGTASVLDGDDPAPESNRALAAAAGADSPRSVGDAQPLPGAFGSAAPAADAASAPPGPTGEDADASAEPTPARPWWRRRIPLLWAGSLVAAGLIGAALALSVHAIGAGQVAVLQADSDAAWPENMFEPRPEGAKAFEEFYGLRALYVPQQMMPGDRASDCLYIATPEASSFGFYGAACGAGSFPAAVSVLVTSDAPRDLRERFEPGTALQFVLDGSQVRVYAAGPGPDATP